MTEALEFSEVAETIETSEASCAAESRVENDGGESQNEKVDDQMKEATVIVEDGCKHGNIASNDDDVMISQTAAGDDGAFRICETDEEVVSDDVTAILENMPVVKCADETDDYSLCMPRYNLIVTVRILGPSIGLLGSIKMFVVVASFETYMNIIWNGGGRYSVKLKTKIESVVTITPQ